MNGSVASSASESDIEGGSSERWFNGSDHPQAHNVSHPDSTFLGQRREPMTEPPRPTAKAIRETVERPTVWGVVEAEPIRRDQPEPPAHGLRWLVARSAVALHLRRTA